MTGAAALATAARLLWLRRILASLWAIAAFAAQAAEPAPAFQARAGELAGLFDGRTAPDRLFSPAFLAVVPRERLAEIASQLRASYGPAKAAIRIEARSPTDGIVFLRFERAIVRLQMVVNPEPPHLIEGLRVVGVESRAEDLPALFAEIVALPGDLSLAVARLEDPGPAQFLTHKPDRPLAIGSAFKLFVLAELVREVKAGERRWDNVVPLGTPSLPSGFLGDWPRGSPMTLHSLAALMISQSDNSAADTLLSLLGRERVESLLPALGVKAADRNRPFLSTREAFALKLGDPALLAEWKSGDEPRRRDLLKRLAAVDSSTLNPLKLRGRPAAIDSVEWFASPEDLVRTLDWLRRSGDRTALDLLAINSGLGPSFGKNFDYLGFKGGSEPGVLNLSFLVKTRDGRWLAATATWNDPTTALDEPRFIALMARLLTLIE